ncbi:MAG: pre-16S rRNA-processing nuclease YqgF [Fimbriimonas ginsengisoli]|uniref:Pre-16S rRNA-processing nuclease YqgF n=1 Tax=Fimbriimonas ginsengisoli TaxID=1005039 RepID=A0A931PTD0_FIMGI|nr:pre-16S rRNA-processing nuclease YqgF [Fimbriimonas ginsengisoli]
MNAKTVLAVDPGSSKCGLAVVERDEQGGIHLRWRAIVPRGALEVEVLEAFSSVPFTLAVVGAGTRSKEVVTEIREVLPSMAVLVVDERDTTMHARERYWEHNPRRGWRRLLPATLQVPPDPVDDFVALILAERVLGEGH